MIRPLRTVHLWSFCALAVVLPAIVVTGLLSRSPSPAESPALGSLSPPAPGELKTGLGITYLGQRLTAKIGTDPAGSRFLVIHKMAESIEPDLHLYWVPEESGDGMPGAGSYLIGTFREEPVQVFPLAEEIKPNSGQIVLFSLADGDVVESAPFAVR